ncbi:MAG: tyrosine--tRNA ligase [Phycisphaerae bacterium]|nr:tyrosine--tRNA ligase [Phycisphaerae bacterium]
MQLSEQMQWIGRGAERLYTPPELERKLGSGRTLRIKLGLDPTAPDIHLGHTVVLRKMRQFQDLGHKAVLIIGDYTARVGDPSGRDATRPVLDEQAIEANARTYLDQAGKILDTSDARFELRRNSEWLSGLGFADVLRLTGQFTVQQMLHRDNFKKRMAEDREIQLSEFMYPLMQAYDSVVVEADVELGATDQTFNNLRGRDLMGKRGLDPQVVVVMPILVGLDGHEKMSKSKGNYVGVTDEPNDMFGKLMSIPDGLMGNYFELLTDLPEPRIRSLLDPGLTHPREAKDALARVVVEAYHDAEAANAASDEFRSRFTQGNLPTDLKTVAVAGGESPLAALIAGVGFAASNSEARRLIQQGGVSFDGEKITDPKARVSVPTEPVLLQVGKRRVCQVKSE